MPSAAHLRLVPARSEMAPSPDQAAAVRPAAASAPADDERLARARAGDGLAFAEIVKRHQAGVFGLALRMLNQREQAEELAQDVFLQLHRSLGAIESADHLRFWLRRVVMHRAIDRVRQRAREPLSPMDEAPEPASVERAAGPDSRAPAGRGRRARSRRRRVPSSCCGTRTTSTRPTSRACWTCR